MADVQTYTRGPGNVGSLPAHAVQGPNTSPDAGGTLAPGGMRGIGLIVFMLAQITLKMETLSLARDYYNVNKKDFDFYKATHQPGMAASAEEVMNSTKNPYYTPDLYASSPAGMAKASRGIDQKWFAARRRAHRYAVGAQQRIDYDFSVMRAASVASGWNMGRRYEMAWADAHNERAFNRKLAMANVGLSVGNTMRKGLATAVGRLENAYSGLGSTVNSFANGYYERQGYNDGRQQTRTRYGASNAYGNHQDIS